MNLKQTVKLIAIITVVSFLCLYFTSMGGYYESNLKQRNILTEEAIAQFEKDVAAGKEIIASNYIQEEKDYNDKISRLTLKASNTIIKTFNKIMKSIFKYLEKSLNS